MSEWKCRRGIVLTEVCGVHLLVADREAMKECRYVRRVNEAGAFIWERLAEGRSVGEIPALLREEYDIPDGCDLQADVGRFLGALREGHYIEDAAGSPGGGPGKEGGGVS